jgi:hypothetical protein
MKPIASHMLPAAAVLTFGDLTQQPQLQVAAQSLSEKVDAKYSANGPGFHKDVKRDAAKAKLLRDLGNLITNLSIVKGCGGCEIVEGPR